MSNDEDKGHHEDRDDEIFEGRMAQYEDRLDKRGIKGRVEISEQLKGKAKERWIKFFGSDKKAEEGDIK